MVLSNPKNSNVFYGWPLWKATSKIWNGYLISLVLLKDGHFWLVAKVLIRFEWENWNSNLESYLICRKVYHCIWQEYAALWCCSSCWITTTTDSIPISFNFLMLFITDFLRPNFCRLYYNFRKFCIKYSWLIFDQWGVI